MEIIVIVTVLVGAWVMASMKKTSEEAVKIDTTQAAVKAGGGIGCLGILGLIACVIGFIAIMQPLQ